MYRMNYNNCSSPRDRLHDSLLSRIAEQRTASCNRCNQSRSIERDCGCDETVERRADIPMSDCNYNYDSDDFDYSLAMVYSPLQEWQNVYCIEEGFVAGTIFKELDKPFYGPKCNGGFCHE